MENFKVYGCTVEGNRLYFVNKANAEKEGEVTEIDMSPEEFKTALKGNNFVDADEYFKAEAAKMKGQKTAPKKPRAKKAEKPANEVEELKQLIESLQTQVNEVKTENEHLKQLRIDKKMSFEEAQKVYAKKARLIRDLNVFLSKKEALDEIGEIPQGEKDPLTTDSFKLVFVNCENYRNDDVLKTSNRLIIEEFIGFITGKISERIDSLKAEIETIDFI